MWTRCEKQTATIAVESTSIPFIWKFFLVLGNNPQHQSDFCYNNNLKNKVQITASDSLICGTSIFGSFSSVEYRELNFQTGRIGKAHCTLCFANLLNGLKWTTTYTYRITHDLSQPFATVISTTPYTAAFNRSCERFGTDTWRRWMLHFSPLSFLLRFVDVKSLRGHEMECICVEFATQQKKNQ